jgi:membrane protein implicated in regulation of membrane protease activity
MFNWFKDKNSHPNYLQKFLQGEAIVSEPIRPPRTGQVFFKGSWWMAKSSEDIPLDSDQIVEVVDIDNITLIVKPIVLGQSQQIFKILGFGDQTPTDK